ncbi:MAG TPA: secretin N-terminal domain-containing protein [Verrucomicrobiae bacterium]
MKLVPTFIWMMMAVGGWSQAAEPSNEAAAGSQTPQSAAAVPGTSQGITTPAPLVPDTNGPATPSDTGAYASGTGVIPDNDTNGLRLNFRGASLDSVLNYLSEAAGFIIVLEAQPRGRVDVWSSQPLTKDEAVDLLNSVLNKSGYAAIRRGRTLTIVNKDEAKTKAIPVRLGGDPESIPQTDEFITQIIPVRYVEVTQLLKDLQPLVSSQTSMTANESGNSVVITDTQANIRRVAEVIKCIDNGAEDVTVVRVFRLRNSNPTEMADLLTSLFPDDSRSGGSQAPFQFGGPGGFRRMFGGGGPFGGGSQGSSASQNQRIRKRNRVIAVADQRTACVVVTATKDLMDQIEGVVTELDADKQNVKTVAVIPLEHAEPQDAMQVLQDIFQKSGTQNSRNQQSQNNALQSRSTQQNQQYNNSSRSGMGQSGARRGSSFGQ